MPNFKKSFSSVVQFEEHIKEEFSYFIKDISFKLIVTSTEDKENIILLEPVDSPLSLLIGYIKDNDVFPLYSNIQVIPDYLTAIENNKTKSFDKISIVSKVNSGNNMDEIVENTFKTIKISDQKGKTEMKSPFLNKLLKYIENH